MKLRNFFLAAALLSLSACVTTKTVRNIPPGESAAHFEDPAKHVSLDYLLYMPAAAVSGPQQKWPAILFLHGSGERGTNVWAVAKHGPPKLLTNRTDFPFIVISPQCPPSLRQWDTTNALPALIKDVMHRYPIDPDRFYLSGLSMGGSGTWRLLLAHPELFAAAVPICGRTDTNALANLPPKKLKELKRVPIWVFHGAKDPTVPVHFSEDMAAALKAVGADVKLTVYPEAVHDSWTQTYDNPRLFDWLLSDNRKTNAGAGSK